MISDNNHKPFIWRKKYEEQGIKIDEKQIEQEHKRKAEFNKIELQKIKERQRIRNQEYQQKISDNEFMQRQKELEQHNHWEQQEGDFILRQHRQRSKIRIRDGRPKAIDFFAHYVDMFGAKISESTSGLVREEEIDLSDSPIELLNPCDWFNGLRLSDLEELEPDITMYMNADHKENRQYWDDLLKITRDEVMKLRAVKGHSSCDIDSTIRADIMLSFEDKSIEELNDLEDELIIQLDENDPAVDSEFIKKTLLMLRAYRARIRLTSRHKQNLMKSKFPNRRRADDSDKLEATETEATIDKKEEEGEDDLTASCIQAYLEGRYTPDKIDRELIDEDATINDYEEDYQALVRHRNQICNPSVSDEDREFLSVAKRGMDPREESSFSCEAPIRQTHSWNDKYQPRKPRYFNRVHTGFEWNKYNQTHYDIDNPPPKVVQGYKFNIFYPDLIDKTKAPTFKLTPCNEDNDFCIIRFSAGPPYEDIAFRIVNREWNNSHKSGYRCQFINNMLQLWFQFKRYRYRR